MRIRSKVLTCLFLLSFAAALGIFMIVPPCGMCTTVQLVKPADAPPPWPNSAYRFRDLARHAYAPSYQDNYSYADATVILTYQEGGATTFSGHLSATNLKPNFAYQMKLLGKPTGLYGVDGDDATNERLGYAGRWWRKQPNPGPATDAEYEANHDNPAYIYEGFILFDFLLTDRNGNAEFDFSLDSSYHILHADWEGRPQGPCDNPLRAVTVEGSASDVAYNQDVGPTVVGVYPQIERLCDGETVLALGETYNCRFFLTEESFEQSGGSVHPGWVTVSGKHFQRDGGDYYYAGTNCYYLMVYAADPGYRVYVDEVLEEAKAMGLGVVRTWAFNDGDDEWNALQKFPGDYNEYVFVGLDYVLAKARELGLQLILPLVNYNPEYGGMDQYVEWSPTASTRDDFYDDANCRNYYKDHVYTVLNRVNTFNGITYKNDPTVFAWELANEPHCESNPNCALHDWIVEMSDYIKSLDANHLVTTGIYGNLWGLGSDFVQDHLPSSIDFATFHIYPDYHGMGGDLAAAMSATQTHIDEADQQILKPVIMEEFNKYRPLTGATGRDAFLQSWYDLLYGDASAGTAAAGTNFWILYHDAYTDFDGFGVYYPGDASTVAIIETEARRMRDLSSMVPQEGSWASALCWDDLLFHLGETAEISPVPDSSNPIPCSGSRTVDFHYTQGGAEIRGYSVRVQCTGSLSFDDGDIAVNPQPPGLVENVDYILHVYQAPDATPGASDWTVDYVILGDLLPGEGIPSGADLFSIVCEGGPEGTGVLSIHSAALGALNGPPVPVSYGNTVVVEVDCTPPEAATDITAARSVTDNNTIDVQWTAPGGDETHFEVYRGLWHDGTPGSSAYPEYDDVHAPPPRPADREYAATHPAEWVLAVTVDAGTTSIVDGGGGGGGALARGVYYYEVFAGDAAGNYGPRASASDRATSYLLGDIDGDGQITLGADITLLGAAYGESDGQAQYNNECDVGPTDDYSGSGIPLTDNEIGFEDLLIFALNYDEVLAKSPPGGGSVVARLSWDRIADRSWALSLREPCLDLKGVRLVVEVPVGSVSSLVAGDLLREQDAPSFLQNIARNGLDVGLALLGRGTRIVGAGELFRVTLAADYDLSEAAFVLRNSANEPVEFELETTTGIPEIPAAYGMSANYPNPFNPATHIQFDLPEPQHVTLAVYAVDGRQIATLVDAALPAGSHRAIWQGRTDRGEMVASGIYFYRIEAGPFRKTSKMILLK